MKKQSTFTKHLFTYGAMSALFLWTAGSSVSLAQTTDSQVNDFSAVHAGAVIEDANSTSQTPDFVASTEDDMLAPAAAGTNAKMDASTREVETEAVAGEKAATDKQVKKASAGSKLKSLPAKILMKTAVRKIEKAQKRMDIKAEKAAKEGKALDQQVKIGIIIAVIGLLLLIVGAAAYSGILYGLGGLALVVGLVIILLAALEVI